MATTRLYPKKTTARAFRVVIRFYGIALLAAMLAHFIWTRIELRKYSLAVQELRLAGEPGTLDDLNHPPVNDPRDPVAEWRAAFRAIDPATAADDTALDAFFAFPLTNDEAAKLHVLVEANRSVLEHVKAAAANPQAVDWAVHFISPAINTLMPELNQQRHVCELISVAALDAHYRGEDGEAVERIGQVLAAERAMSRYPGMIGHLVSVGFGARGDWLVNRIAPDLSIQSAGESDGKRASPQQVTDLCRELLDESWRLASLRYAFQTARVMEADDVMRVAGMDMTPTDSSAPNVQTTGWSARLKHYMFEPLVYANGRDMLDVGSTTSRLSQSLDWPAFQAAYSRQPDPKQLHFFANFFVESEMVASQRAITNEHQSTTNNRMRAIQLALRLYAINHDNRLPTALDALIPEYLPSIPLDPMTTGQQLHYKPGSDPIIYSVGPNGVDDGGSETPNDPRITDNPWEQKDVVIHLNRRPRVTPPADNPPPASTQP